MDALRVQRVPEVTEGTPMSQAHMYFRLTEITRLNT